MRARLMPTVLWLVATAVAVAVGLSATRLVASRVAGPPAVIPIDVAQDAPDEAAAVPDPSPDPTATPPATPAQPSPSTAAPATAPPAPTTSEAAQTRTVSVLGGSAALHFIDGRVEVLWATPNAGFTADVESHPGGTEARVDFRSDGHRSRIRGEWEGGSPAVETEERPDD